MEKILLGAYLSILAAFITAAASIVKLVNEKESKTTDYRQSWTDSVRKSLSQLIASITLQSSYIIAVSEIAQALDSNNSKQSEPDKEKFKEYLRDELTAINKSIRENRQYIQQNYALTALHFKPHDETFIKIENKFELANQLLQDMGRMQGKDKNTERNVAREKIKAIANEITETARHILKTEWEHVKKGEPTYKITKNWSLYIGISAFSVLLFIGIYMLAVANASPLHPSTQSPQPTKASPIEKNDAATERVEVHQNVTIPPSICTKTNFIKSAPKTQCKLQPDEILPPGN